MRGLGQRIARADDVHRELEPDPAPPRRVRQPDLFGEHVREATGRNADAGREFRQPRWSAGAVDRHPQRGGDRGMVAPAPTGRVGGGGGRARHGGRDPAGGVVGGQPAQPGDGGVRGGAVGIEEGEEAAGAGLGADPVCDAGRDDRGLGGDGPPARVGQCEPSAGHEQDLHGGVRVGVGVADLTGERHQPGAEHHPAAPRRRTHQASARRRGARSRWNRSRNRRWSWPGAWNTRWLRPASR
ncbi:Uncharacterised protein [Mycobacteroides abscessus subsp. abscessus]|nr:Uncharacterised protein [Mycobacteroides abscessus subsp. abscessus]